MNRWVFFSTALGAALDAATPAERVAAVVAQTERMQAVPAFFQDARGTVAPRTMKACFTNFAFFSKCLAGSISALSCKKKH